MSNEGIVMLEKFINEVSQEIAELPDRNSPDDWPEAMLVTHDELKEIITGVHEIFPLFAHAMPKSEGKPVAAMRNALDMVDGMFWVEQTTKHEIYESIHYPGPNKFDRYSLAKHISQLLRELDGEVFENNILATQQPTTDISELVEMLGKLLPMIKFPDGSGTPFSDQMEALIAKHTVKA